jgi:hypothetical protein
MGQAACIPQPDVAGWTPSVLTEYEVGRAVWAAQMIARSDKSVAEVGACKVETLDALTADLLQCLKIAGHAAGVKVWTRPTSGNRVRYGFYREAWVLDALDFLDRAKLADADHAWISGLLFGYRPDAIQDFIARTTGR